MIFRTSKQIAQEALEAFEHDPTTPEQHFQNMVDAGFINHEGQVTSLLGGEVPPEPGTPVPQKPPPGTAKWKPSTEPLPELEVGDRVLIVVEELPFKEARFAVKSIVILIATEIGWSSPDPVYGGYSPEDGIAWMLEQDLLNLK